MRTRLFERLKKKEGTGPMLGGRHLMYECSEGKKTIGYGRNLESTGIRIEEAEMMLKNDIAECNFIAHQFPWFKGLNEARQDVVLEMLFQLGLEGFQKFRKAIVAIEKGDFETAAIEMLDSQWHKQTPSRAEELATMMRTGKHLV